jgi:phasin family protein
MTTKPEDFLLEAWKRQADAGLRLVEAMVEGSTRIRELQLEAAAEAHADLEATRKALAAATGMPQLLKLQTKWAQANASKCLAYWRSVCEAAMQTDAALVKCACGQAAVPLPESFKSADLEASREALLGMVDSAYKQWLDAAQRFYKPLERLAA